MGCSSMTTMKVLLVAAFLLVVVHSINVEVAFPSITVRRPVDLQHDGTGNNMLYIVSQYGVVYRFNTASPNPETFLDISDKVACCGELGLLGITFHPQYASNGYFYVNYNTDGPLRTVVSRFTLSDDGQSANRSSELVILEYGQPYGNHNGGQVLFGNDGYLYISSGDGGSGGDPHNNGQNTASLLGKILRIDVDNTDSGKNYGIPSDNPFYNSTNGAPEIWAWGLRNPWRMSFDRPTGMLWTGDVGQGAWEEVDIIEGGKNYGWREVEGFVCYVQGCNPSLYEPPVVAYGRSDGVSVTGGYVYRGSSVQELIGSYVYGDFGSKKFWKITCNSTQCTNIWLTDSNISPSAFGVDQNNELYVLAYEADNGKIYKFNNEEASVITAVSDASLASCSIAVLLLLLLIQLSV